MEIHGKLTTIKATDIAYGDVVMSGGSSGVAMRYVVGQPYVNMGYVVFPVGTQPGGYAVGHWEVRSDILSYSVIRPLADHGCPECIGYPCECGTAGSGC